MPAGKLTLVAPSKVQSRWLGQNYKALKRRSRRYKRNQLRGNSRRPMSTLKFNAIDSSAGATGLQSASPFTSFDITNITRGDEYTERSSNNICVKSWTLRLSLANAHTAGRFLRTVIVGLRGAQNAGDTATWTDLLLDPSGLSKNAPTGINFDLIASINRDEYICYFDKTVKIPGTNDGMSNSTHCYHRKKMSHLVNYVAGSTDVRKGKLWCIMFYGEEAGVSPAAVNLSVNYASIVRYYDTM